jgi:hypothetical protein
MAYSILLTVKRPDEVKDRNGAVEYANFQNILEGLTTQNKEIQWLAEGTILLRIDHGLQPLMEVLKSLRHLPYIYTILTEETKWYEGIKEV